MGIGAIENLTIIQNPQGEMYTTFYRPEKNGDSSDNGSDIIWYYWNIKLTGTKEWQLKAQKKKPQSTNADDHQNFLEKYTGWSGLSLQKGKKYDCMITAELNDGSKEGAPGNIVTFVPSTDKVPSIPTNLVIKKDDANHLTLSWKAPKNNGGTPIIGYGIQRRNKGKNEKWVVINPNTKNTNLTFDTFIEKTDDVEYKVLAINKIGSGAYSNAASYTSTVECKYCGSNMIYPVTQPVHTIPNNKLPPVLEDSNGDVAAHGCSNCGKITFIDLFRLPEHIN